MLCLQPIQRTCWHSHALRVRRLHCGRGEIEHLSSDDAHTCLQTASGHWYGCDQDMTAGSTRRHDGCAPVAHPQDAGVHLTIPRESTDACARCGARLHPSATLGHPAAAVGQHPGGPRACLLAEVCHSEHGACVSQLRSAAFSPGEIDVLTHFAQTLLRWHMTVHSKVRILCPASS